jgi:hypothetical protein
MWKGARQIGTDVIMDKLWLPTEWEMKGGGYDYWPQSSTVEETGVNQAHLEYYTEKSKRVKYNGSNENRGYFLASPSLNLACFCYVGGNGELSRGTVSCPGFFAPAFCVK